MKDRIKKAIEAICGNIGDGWILIMEEPETESFVQFAFDSSSGLVFDLPFQALNQQQTQLARQVLGRYEIVPYTVPAFAGSTNSEEEQPTFNADMGFNTELATELSFVCFNEIYKLPGDFSFNVTITR